MCPKNQIISLYHDGELPSPWKEKMESHIAACACCAQRLKVYRDISSAANGASVAPSLKDAPSQEIEAARERVWLKLEQSVSAGFAGSPRPERAIWRRRIAIPLPVAAAVALFFLAAFLFAFRVAGNTEASDLTIAAEAEFDTPGIIPVSDMEDVLQYLGIRDSGDFVILRLPESQNFVNSGEPSILRAADYTRQMQGTRGRRP